MDRSPQKIRLSTHDFIHLVEVDNIIYCESNNSYTTFHLLGEENKITISVSIKQVEQQLNSVKFIRPHQSYLVNTKYIKRMYKISDGQLLLSTGAIIPVSSRKRKEVLNFFKHSPHIQTQ